MYTRCPECSTPFKITHAQLALREGLVRCGKCDSVFLATEQMLELPPRQNHDRVADHHERSAATPARKRGTRKTRRKHAHRARAAEANRDPTIPTISELSFVPKRRRLPPVVGAIGNLALLLLLVGQVMFFYPNEVAQFQILKSSVADFCQALGCRIEPPAPPAPPELNETTIAPHPRFANALRIRAVMVNRAAATQPLPLMEVSLTDSNGALVARRTFEPRQYLERPQPAAGRMEPNVAINTLIDVMNPDGKAVGYEVKLLARDETLRTD